MRAKSIKGKSPEEIQSALQQSMGDGFTPTLAIVFISVKQNRHALINLLKSEGLDVIGATSCNEFINGAQSEGDIAMILLDTNKSNYIILFEEIGTSTIEKAATNLAEEALKKFDKPSLLICSSSLSKDGVMLDGFTLTRTLEKTLGSGTNIFGGMAGDDMTFTGTYVFTADYETDYGIAALVFNEQQIVMRGIALSGWKAIGVLKTITKSVGNLLYEIDGKPALEVYLKFLGEDFDSTDDRIKFFDSVGLHYPLQIERTGHEPMMCNPIGYNKEENALIMESEIAKGAKFRFSTPPDFDIVDAVIEKATAIKADANENADAVLIFSCASRLNALGLMAQQENDGLAAVWNAPMAGFFTYGEFGRAIDGKHEFHSTTCSWVALKEK
jgi:hypothetical protein